MWKPSASMETLHKRAEIMNNVRAFFNGRGYLEVETPSLSPFGTSEVHLSSIASTVNGKPYFLHTSPEYAMKRLLASGSGPIFQLARVYRDEELGRWHNPEFTMLEWYSLDIDHHDLISEVDEFLQTILKTPALQKITYRDAFLQSCDVDPFTASLNEFKNILIHHELANVFSADESDRCAYLYLLMSHIVEPYLAKFDMPIAVYDFPKDQASLAIVSGEYAHRFEIYYRGLELANGFHELCDPVLQRERFRADNEERMQKGLAPSLLDTNFLSALESGLPACSGIAVGIDRLIAIALKAKSLAEVMAFDFSRC